MKANFLNKTGGSKSLISIFILFFVFLFSNGIKAQSNSNFEKLYNQAKVFYEKGNYTQAIAFSKKAVAINDNHVNSHLILAYSYEEIDSVISEIIHLKKALEIEEIPEANYWMGEAFYKLGRYSEALFYYNQYKDYKYISGKRKLVLACKMASSTFEIQALKKLSNNTSEEIAGQEYWPSPLLNGTLVFNQLQTGKNETLREDLFSSNTDSLKIKDTKSLESITKTNRINSNSKSGALQLIFFTACNREDGWGDCDIYFSRIIDGIWSEPTNAGNVLNSEYSEAQPSFSSKTNMLYFTSNRPGGKGEKDIWMAKLMEFNEEGLPVWEQIKNATAINSKGNEISPFIDSKEQNLYFASDSQVGMGGYDIFQSEILSSGSIRNIKNLGYPINTNADELGLLITYMYDTAYFSSARAGDTGLEIFAYNLTRGLHTNPSAYYRIRISNRKTKKAVEADIELIETNSLNAPSRIEKTNEKGEKVICLPTHKNYSLNISANGYMFYSQLISAGNTNSIEESEVLEIELDPIEIGAAIDLYSIYYETNSYKILPTSEPELDRLVAFLSKNKALKVEIQGHTDSTGDPESNLELSKQRARSVIDYLITNKINISRLKYSGYGDEIPVASNETEEGRSLNRRTTIKITEL